MDPVIKQKWIEDLRSGKYAQAEGQLRDLRANSYCCLGVLCLSVGATFDELRDDDEFGTRQLQNVPLLDGKNIGFGEDPELSREFMASIGLPRDQQAELIKLNDSGVPFAMIADYIEANL